MKLYSLLLFCFICTFSFSQSNTEVFLFDIDANTSKIEVHSDGTPKRPLVHVEDICRVIYELIVSDESHVLLVNVGSDHMNYSVKEIAQKISEITDVKNLSFGEKDNDQRSYMIAQELKKTTGKGWEQFFLSLIIAQM